MERAKKIVMDATGCSCEDAAFYLEDSEQNPKLAIIRILSGERKEAAITLLERNEGYVRKTLENKK